MAQMAYLTQVMLDHPVALWALTDAVGAGVAADINPTEFNPINPGTPHGTVTFGQAGPVSGLTAALFGGASGDGIQVPSAPVLNGGAAALSIEFLMKSTSVLVDQSICEKWGTGWAGGPSAATYPYVIRAGSGGIGISRYDGIHNPGVGAGALSDGAWHHVVFTGDGSTLRAYTAGAFVTSQPDTTVGSVANTDPVTLGNRGGGGHGWPGTLFGFAVYNYTLSAAQIAAHYAAWQAPAAEIYVPFPRNFQPWDIAASFGGLAAWYTECYQGGGLGTVPTVGKDVIVALAPGSPAIKYWAYPSAINPAG